VDAPVGRLDFDYGKSSAYESGRTKPAVFDDEPLCWDYRAPCTSRAAIPTSLQIATASVARSVASSRIDS
jgi:hypothetical protein